MDTITGRRNPICIHIKKLGSDSGYRRHSGEFLCDGAVLLEEAVKSGVSIPIVLTSSQLPFALPRETRLCFTERSIINSVSPLKNAQEVLFTCKIPAADSYVPYAGTTGARGTHILLDSVQDPGNVGTIIRTANAFGMKSVMLTGDCADVYNPKTIRATMGAIFKQATRVITSEELAALKRNGIKIIGASIGEDSRDFSEADLRSSIIAIGNEGQGLSEPVLSLCDERIKIPITPECESLNAAVAAGIIMWKAGRCMANENP